MKKIILFVSLIILSASFIFANGLIIPSDSSQVDFLKTYKFVLNYSSVDYRFTSTTIDSFLFPKWGEFSFYWSTEGSSKGSFVYPDRTIPAEYGSITKSEYSNYDWLAGDNLSIQFKLNTKNVAIFRSLLKNNNNTISWASIYFKNTFDTYLYNNMYYFTDERDLDTAGVNPSAQILIIPSLNVRDEDFKFYVDSIFRTYPNIRTRLNTFLANGGMIYTEGNAVYFIEKLGWLDSGAVDYTRKTEADQNTNLLDITFTASSNPVSFTEGAVGDFLYASSVPAITVNNADVIATLRDGNPVVFSLTGNNANGGKILCNTGIPTIGGTNELKNGSRQLMWFLNSMMYGFAKKIDYTRSIFNDIPDSLTAGKNAIAYDAIDTFEVRIKLRNLSSDEITNIQIREYFRDYFKFVDVVTPGVESSLSGSQLILSNITVPPRTEFVITYRLRTPDPTDAIHEKIDNYISWATYIYTSYGVVGYADNEGKNSFIKYRNYVDMMFSAKLAADCDLNWKNFLYLNYQPFKVFMIMENKERTPATNTKYVQYIPKDVPFYWTDGKINIPILRTPGGKYVDVLKGSNDESNPEFDMDNDGHPDVWLDVNSIYPKGFTITEDAVYWLNPWEHLRSGDSLMYEDIDHDGKRAIDSDGDGKVDIEEPGDKIRVWVVTWNIGKVNGYDYFDPYCSYEIWVDPPDLVPMSAGVGNSYNSCDDVSGMFYPYSPDISNANHADTSWTHWMERGADGNVIWKQLIYQSLHNYEGFTFIDTLKEGYRLLASDRCVGTVPQPHREFIAVLSLGGEEIDMTKPTPNRSLYSNLEYKTIFNEKRVTPIRTTYTYYAPLPNPLQFEYLSNNFTITDIKNGDTLHFLPEWGKANLTFDIDASTEYSYYWIRNAGHDVMYNDPSEKIEGVEKLGDGVFGYMIYDIPKGLGGYKITLPKKSDGTYDTDAIIKIDGKIFEKWLDNPNTKNAVEIWEDQFQYHVYLPQLLIPPALDDNNFDGKDDWIDDRGDRFCSSTGFLHDAFMLDKGENYLDWPRVPFLDDIYGMVTKGWFPGADSTYGDDFFENLGKTHIKINAIYEGKGKEGPIDISKGGWLVVEEIFGGSPWVIFSHTLSGYSKGTDLRITSKAIPSIVRYGTDTTYIKHTIDDANEPHKFNSDFDPYHVSFGYGSSTVTTTAGGKDPCSLVVPDINTSTIIDPNFNHTNITLVPQADKSNPDLADYPKNVSGTFLEVKIEVMNGTDDNWINTEVTPEMPANLQKSSLVMSYVAYPRPLVPAKADPSTGEVIQGGDDIGSFRAGWRFNQPEGEVLIKMGNKLGLLQPSRRAYFVFLFSIDESLPKGVYNLDFKMNGEKIHYDGKKNGENKYEIPSAYFAVSTRDAKGNVTEYQKIVIGTSDLENIKTNATPYFVGLENAKWSVLDVNNTDFEAMTDKLSAVWNEQNSTETVDLSQFKDFPSVTLSKFNVLEQGLVNSRNGEDLINISINEELNYRDSQDNEFQKLTQKIAVNTVGPKLRTYKKIISINGAKVSNPPYIFDGSKKDIEVEFFLSNYGNDIAENTSVDINMGGLFQPVDELLPQSCSVNGDILNVKTGSFIPGEAKSMKLHFTTKENCCTGLYKATNLVDAMNSQYTGNSRSGKGKEVFLVDDEIVLDVPSTDLYMSSISSSDLAIVHGSYITLKAEYQNGVVPADDVFIRLYLITNAMDTMILGEKMLKQMDAMEKGQFEMSYTVPDDVNYLEAYATVDDNSGIKEFCEENNARQMIVPFKEPEWIINVRVSPNPFDYETDINYILPKEMSKVGITIFTLDSKEVGKIENCGTSVGMNSAHWFAPNLVKGTYIFCIEGVNPEGKVLHYYGKLVKDKE